MTPPPHLHSESLDVVGAVCSACEVGQVELYLVPAVVQSHGHGADKGLHSGGGLIVGGPEPAPDILVIQHLKQYHTVGQSKTPMARFLRQYHTASQSGTSPRPGSCDSPTQPVNRGPAHGRVPETVPYSQSIMD